ncbi:MAG: hypothetical protein ACC742_17320 [Thermoanaerobaculales bacterium]
MKVRTTLWNIYQCPPLVEWEGVVSVEEYVAMLADRGESAVTIDSFVLRFEAAIELVADLTSWDGNGTWVVAALPDVELGQMMMMFVVQRPEGDRPAFIASTTELPWLAAYERLPDDSFQPRQRHAIAAPYLRRIREVRRNALKRRSAVN